MFGLIRTALTWSSLRPLDWLHVVAQQPEGCCATKGCLPTHSIDSVLALPITEGCRRAQCYFAKALYKFAQRLANPLPRRGCAYALGVRRSQCLAEPNRRETRTCLAKPNPFGVFGCTRFANPLPRRGCAYALGVTVRWIGFAKALRATNPTRKEGVRVSQRLAEPSAGNGQGCDAPAPSGRLGRVKLALLLYKFSLNLYLKSKANQNPGCKII